VGVGCFLAPFAEEVLFRGYLFRQLYARARLGFWPSALIPSVLFALGHLYQSSNPSELAGIVGVTGLGSILGCWILLRWGMNLWTVVALHSLMNLWWEVFAVDTTALGGWLANAARLGTIALAILLTIFKDRIWRVDASGDVERPRADSRGLGEENREERRGQFGNAALVGIRTLPSEAT
jgi:membrane protease YdiL (CAAX protease family)